MAIRLKRAYDSPAKNDGYRVLVDGIWPRGVSREDARLDEWLKEIAPSTELRKWFGHDAERWEEFKKRYHRELADRKDSISKLADIEKKLGIKTGESTEDGRYYLKCEEECLAACCGGPMMMVDHVYHEKLTPEKVDEILDKLE